MFDIRMRWSDGCDATMKRMKQSLGNGFVQIKYGAGYQIRTALVIIMRSIVRITIRAQFLYDMYNNAAFARHTQPSNNKEKARTQTLAL